MANKINDQVEVTIKFIEEVKEQFKDDIENGSIPIMPREEDSSNFTDNEQNKILISFTN